MTLRSAMIFSFVACVLAAVGLYALPGCVPTQRAAARGAIHTAAHATKALDDVCAARALERRDVELARQCADAYAGVRVELVEAARALDRWERFEDSQRVACAVGHAATELAAVSRVVRRHGGTIPPEVEDAIAGVSSAGVCVEQIEVQP